MVVGYVLEQQDIIHFRKLDSSVKQKFLVTSFLKLEFQNKEIFKAMGASLLEAEERNSLSSFQPLLFQKLLGCVVCSHNSSSHVCFPKFFDLSSILIKIVNPLWLFDFILFMLTRLSHRVLFLNSGTVQEQVYISFRKQSSKKHRVYPKILNPFDA